MKIKEYYILIKGLFAIKKEIKKMNEIKSGIRSSEFWVNLLVIAITLFAGVMSFIPAALAAKIVAGLAAAYTIARTVVKLTPSAADDAAVEKVGAVLAEKLGIQPK